MAQDCQIVAAPQIPPETVADDEQVDTLVDQAGVARKESDRA